jgi:peptidoglycan hydrolase-like protein with peptidoglycan-binding domain
MAAFERRLHAGTATPAPAPPACSRLARASRQPGRKSAGNQQLQGLIKAERGACPGREQNLKSARFAGDPVFEEVYDDKRKLKLGDADAAVLKLKQALSDAGFPLPDSGLNTTFDLEMETAVKGFQGASGLTGSDRDGVVGATTLGWLDQRFFEGASTKGTTPGATPGCSAISTRMIDIVKLVDSNRDPSSDLKFANTVFNQCCLRFATGVNEDMDVGRTREVLGDDTTLLLNDCGNQPTAQTTRMLGRANAYYKLSSPIRVFYVASTSPAHGGYSFPRFCATGGGAGQAGLAVVANKSGPSVLAHELGHILLNSGANPEDPNNLMHSPRRTGEQLTAAQCASIK